MEARRPLATTGLLVLAGLVLAACTGSEGPGSGLTTSEALAEAGDTGVDHDTDRFAERPPEAGGLGAADADAPDWPWERAAGGEDVPAEVPLDEIVSGGPPPDGIPPIDDPVFESVDEADDWLEANDPLMVVDHNDEVRGYPLAVLTFHEIVNDELGGDPVVVTYCPLCNSGLVFDAEVDGQVLDFGTSGRLWRSNLVMYDRDSRSLWSQFTGEAIVGDRVGQQLERLPMQMVGFAELADRWPDAPVLSRDTGHERPYGQNPYSGYEDGDPFLFDGETDEALAQMDRVVAAGEDDDPLAVPWDRLTEEQVVHTDIGGEPVVVLWAPGAASALDDATISDGQEVGQTGVFDAEVNGRELTFAPADDEDGRFVDEQTGSTWRITGEAVDGQLAGTQLERRNHDDTFWFVQHAFRPETRVVDER